MVWFAAITDSIIKNNNEFAVAELPMTGYFSKNDYVS